MSLKVMEAFLYGIFGGIINEVVGLYKIRKFKKAPDWFKSKSYWVITFLMILAGGGLVCIYERSSIDLTPILAVNIGISAPLMISRIADEALPSDPSDKIN